MAACEEKTTFRGVVEPLVVPERRFRLRGEAGCNPLRDLPLRPVNGERGVSGAWLT